MPQTKTDEIMKKLKRIDGKIDAMGISSLVLWLTAIAVSLILFASTLAPQHPLLSAGIVIVATIIIVLPLYMWGFSKHKSES